MLMSTEKIGYISLVSFLLLDWLFPVFSVEVINNVGVLWLVTLSTWVAWFFSLWVLLKKKKLNQYKQKEIIVPTILWWLWLWIGTLFYFYGIKYLNASLASVLLLLQIPIWFIVFNVFGKEQYNHQQFIGSMLMFIWGFIVVYKWWNLLNIWSLIMLLATVLMVFWNFFVKKASKHWASSFFLLFNRSILMFVIIGIITYLFDGAPNISIIKESFLDIIAIWFLFMFLAKVLWINALKNLNSIIPLSSFPFVSIIAIILAYFMLGETLNNQQIIGLLPIFIGFFLLTYYKIS